MDTIDHKVMAVYSDNSEIDEHVSLYFSDGASFVIPLPKVARTRLVSTQVALTEDGINLITRRNRTTPERDNNEPWIVLQFYYISYSDIKNGKTEWRLVRPSIPATDFNCELVPLNDEKYLACLSTTNDGIPSINSRKIHDWVICGLNDKNKFVEYDSGDWLESESSYLLNGEQRVPKFNNLTIPIRNTIVHTKNYLTICSVTTGRMLVFSKGTGKLTGRIKLTDAVPPEQDSDALACRTPIIIVQPDLDDGIVVLARKDFDIAESIGVFEKYRKLNRQVGATESAHIIDKFKAERTGAEWYRVNLEKRKAERIKPLDVPDNWDDSEIPMPPYFIPFENGQILFGGIKKRFQELIGSVFKKPAQKTKPESPVKAEDE
jgi:hypothetical protein